MSFLLDQALRPKRSSETAEYHDHRGQRPPSERDVLRDLFEIAQKNQDEKGLKDPRELLQSCRVGVSVSVETLANFVASDYGENSGDQPEIVEPLQVIHYTSPFFPPTFRVECRMRFQKYPPENFL